MNISVFYFLRVVGFKKSDVITSSIPTTPPWLLTRPAVNFTLHWSDKSNTPPEMFKHRFYEFCHEFKSPQTYLQRPSPWGRATAGRQDVVSHSYRKAEEILSTFIQPADVGSHHLEY